MNKRICPECKAVLKYRNEYHPYEYCLMAKIDPIRWRENIRKIIMNAEKFEEGIIRMRDVKKYG